MEDFGSNIKLDLIKKNAREYYKDLSRDGRDQIVTLELLNLLNYLEHNKIELKRVYNNSLKKINEKKKRVIKELLEIN